MKKTIGILIVLITAVSVAIAGNMEMTPFEGSADFQKIKQLAGKWQGTHVDHNGETVPVTAEYVVTSNDSVVMELLNTGTPHEMVSIYHDKKGKLSMTHYCALGNQPQMELIFSGENKIGLKITKDQQGIDVDTESHMHSLEIKFIGDNKIVHNWAMFEAGEQKMTTEFKLTRVLE